MSIFNFSNKQRLHTQLYGHTSGKEMFHIDEYRQKRKITTWIIGIEIFMVMMFYYTFAQMPKDMRMWLILGTIGLGIYGYFNYKSQKQLRRNLY